MRFVVQLERIEYNLITLNQEGEMIDVKTYKTSH